MFEKVYHLFGLRSPQEMKEMERQFTRSIRQGEIDISRIMAEQITGERRKEVDAIIQEAQRSLDRGDRY